MMNLDETDLQILQLLRANARLTNKEIGERLNKTATPIFKRIKRLEEQGYIKGYVAVLDYEKLDRGLVAFTHVQIKDHSRVGLQAFLEQAIAFDEVLECYQTSGEFDFILRIAAKDIKSYQDFMINKLIDLVPLTSVKSTFIMREAKK